MSKPLSAEAARAIAAKLAARARYDGIEVGVIDSATECAGIVEVVEVVAVTVSWQCPSCRAAFVKRSRPEYAVLRACSQCGAKFFLRRPEVPRAVK